MVNKNLENIRKLNKMSHNQVAQKSGISRVFYTMIENGQRTPSMGVAKRLSMALNISLDQLFDALEVTKGNNRRTS